MKSYGAKKVQPPTTEAAPHRIPKSHHDDDNGDTPPANMSVMRLQLRPLPSASRTCMRYFSSASKKQGEPAIPPLHTHTVMNLTPPTEDVLDILKTSTAGRHPSNTGAPFPSKSPSKSPSTPPPTSALSRFARGAGLDSTTPSRELAESERIAQYQRQIYRKWQPGDVYAPHDLSGSEQKKWKYGRKKPQQDAFDVLGINPVLEYKNFTMMSEYMTEMGRIKHSKDTGLRPKNQRKIAKAIRRAVGLGLMPSVHRHPLVLKKSSPTRFL